MSKRPTSDGLETGNSASTGDLGGYADVTGSSTVLPVRSVSSFGALYTRIHSQSTTTTTADRGGGGDDNAASDDELLSSLLLVTRTAGVGGGGDTSGLTLRRRRRSNAVENLDSSVRTSSPIGVGVVSDLGQRRLNRRRSLPAPRLTVHDVAVTSSAVRPFSDSYALASNVSQNNAITNSVADGSDHCLSNIDENMSASTIISTSAASCIPDASQRTKSTLGSVTNNDETTLVNSTVVDGITLNVSRGNSRVGPQSVTDTWTSSKVDSVEGSSSQTNANIVEVPVSETAPSTWLPRRSQSLRLYRVRCRSAARGEIETQQLDTKVAEFQTRAAPEREALRNRLRKLSLMYATDSDETSRTWPTSRRPCADDEVGHVTSRSAAIPHRPGDGVASASSSTSTLQLKYDTDSLSSQKDEGFETASISSDVYLSSSQRSSMCDCDAALTITATPERQADLTTTATTGSLFQTLPETLPPPPASFLHGLELAQPDTTCTATENSSTGGLDSVVVVPQAQVESVELDVQCRPPSDTSSSAVTTEVKRSSESSKEPRGSGIQPEGVKSAGGSRRPAAPPTGSRQTKPATARPAPATPLRVSSLAASSSSRKFVSTTRSTPAAATTKQTDAPNSVRSRALATVKSSAASAAAVTSGRPAAFQRSSPLRATDNRKQDAGSGSVPPAPSSSFVRQSQTRSTIAAPELRTNKRIAAEARRIKATTRTPPTDNSGVTPSCRTTASTSTSTTGSLADRQQRIRSRTSDGSCSSTTSSSAASKFASFRPIGCAAKTLSRCPTASVNVPSAPSKKSAAQPATSSSSSKMPSNVRNASQASSSRLRIPLITKRYCT